MRKNELIIPPSAMADPNSVEVVRGWCASDGRLHLSLWKGDPGRAPVEAVLEVWGSLLCELALHLALMLHKDDGRDLAETVRALKEIFDTAMDEVSVR